jgi:hypothetical protein
LHIQVFVDEVNGFLQGYESIAFAAAGTSRFCNACKGPGGERIAEFPSFHGERGGFGNNAHIHAGSDSGSASAVESAKASKDIFGPVHGFFQVSGDPLLTANFIMIGGKQYSWHKVMVFGAMHGKCRVFHDVIRQLQRIGRRALAAVLHDDLIGGGTVTVVANEVPVDTFRIALKSISTIKTLKFCVGGFVFQVFAADQAIALVFRHFRAVLQSRSNIENAIK